MVGRSVLAAAVIALSAGLAAAQPTDWIERSGKRAALADLAGAYSWAVWCGRQVNHDVARRFLERTLGPAHRYDGQQVTDMMWMLASIAGVQRETLQGVKPERPCAQAEGRYGRNGTAIPGLLN